MPTLADGSGTDEGGRQRQEEEDDLGQEIFILRTGDADADLGPRRRRPVMSPLSSPLMSLVPFLGRKLQWLLSEREIHI